MKRMGTAVMTDSGLMAKVMRSEACQQCGGCQMGQRQEQFYPLPAGQYRPGDPVVIDIPDEGTLPATVLGYGIPLAGLLVGLGIAALLSLPEILQALIALAGAAAGYAVLKALEPKVKANRRFQMKIEGCPRAAERNSDIH
ncbi:MAG: SoxR reducing system RseC family protein [Clostridia bacterium]|nr:SoxR reducing system RseC family protein [Clostridia bacterium]